MLSAKTKLYYGTDSFRVSLLVLPSGGVLKDRPEKGFDKDWIIITGDAQLERNGQKEILAKASRVKPDANGTCRIENVGATVLEILEIAWTKVPSNDDPLPLPDVTENRPWGSFTVLEDQPHFKLKQLYVKPGHRLSLQRHQKREEHWYVTAGNPEITVDHDILHKPPGSYVKIPRTAWHRLANPPGQTTPVEIIELQLGDYFGEDDIERSDDDYGRNHLTPQNNASRGQ